MTPCGRLAAALLFPSFLFSQIQLQSAFPSLTFTNPLDLQAPPDNSNRIAVVTQPGVIYIFPNLPSVTQPKVLLDISDSVVFGGEQGLLGMAFHPDFTQNRHFFVNYVAPNPRRTVIARFTVSAANPDSADKTTRLVILEVGQPYENHNAGQLAFGPDGYLYIGMGDGGSGGDPLNNAQNNAVLLGKFLRIDVNATGGGKNYTIPPDNPFLGNSQGYREEIFAYGFRNPWRYSFDEAANRLWVGDVGQGAWEEIDIVEKGKNYGWRIMEGSHCYNPPAGCNTTGLTMPVWDYDRSSAGGSSVTGGYVYRGTAIPEMYGKYVYGDFISGNIWFLTYDGISPPVNTLFSASGLNISSFGVDRQKELYVCAFDGKIYKFVKTLSTGTGRTEVPSRVFYLKQNYPNPFNPTTAIEFSLPQEGRVSLTIYDLVGKEVKKLLDGFMPTGMHQVRWSGTNQQGLSVSSGVYVCRLVAGERIESRRIVLLR
jgi:glucose/arabinose dehydrogenase